MYSNSLHCCLSSKLSVFARNRNNDSMVESLTLWHNFLERMFCGIGRFFRTFLIQIELYLQNFNIGTGAIKCVSQFLFLNRKATQRLHFICLNCLLSLMYFNANILLFLLYIMAHNLDQLIKCAQIIKRGILNIDPIPKLV